DALLRRPDLASARDLARGSRRFICQSTTAVLQEPRFLRPKKAGAITSEWPRSSAARSLLLVWWKQSDVECILDRLRQSRKDPTQQVLGQSLKGGWRPLFKQIIQCCFKTITPLFGGLQGVLESLQFF